MAARGLRSATVRSDAIDRAAPVARQGPLARRALRPGAGPRRGGRPSRPATRRPARPASDRRTRPGRRVRGARGRCGRRRRRSAGPRGTARRRRAGIRRTWLRPSAVAAWTIIPSDSLRQPGAVELDEGQIVATGEDPDALERDEPAADAAVDAVRERRKAVARIHRPSVYCLMLRSASAGPDCRPIPPGGIIDDVRDRCRTRQGRPHVPQPNGRTTAEPDTGPLPPLLLEGQGRPVRRLSRMEGQVRGIARMIEREEYCVDILQQTRPCGPPSTPCRSWSSRTTSRAASGPRPSAARRTSTSTR